MILDTTALKLEAVLSAAITTSQPEVHVDYVVFSYRGETTKPSSTRTALNSTTDVTILAAPGTAGYVHKPIGIYIYNKDTVACTVTVKTDDGTTERIILKQTLNPTDTLCWDESVGWYII